MNTNWFFKRGGSSFIKTQAVQPKLKTVKVKEVRTSSRKDSDEHYVFRFV